MKRLVSLGLFVACLLPSPVFASWSLVQQGGTGTAGAGTTAAHAMSSLTTETLIVCFTTWANATGQTVSGVVDTLKNTYVAGDTALNPSPDVFGFQSWYAVNAGGSGANTVTVTYSASTTNKVLRCRGYDGTATSTPLDAAKKGNNQSAPGTGTDAITTTATASATTQTNDLVVVGTMVRSAFTTVSAGTGYANIGHTDDTFYAQADEDKNQATTATVTGTFTATDAGAETATQVLTFKEPATSACGRLSLLGVGCHE